jgi:hypothetical protein
MWSRIAKLNEIKNKNKSAEDNKINKIHRKNNSINLQHQLQQSSFEKISRADSLLSDSYDIYSRINTRNNRSVKFNLTKTGDSSVNDHHHTSNHSSKMKKLLLSQLGPMLSR